MPIVPTFQREDLPQAMQTGPQANVAAAGLPGEALARLGDAGTDFAIKMIDADNFDWLRKNVSDFAVKQQDALDGAQQGAVKSGNFKGAAQTYNQQIQADQAARIASAPTPHVADLFLQHSTGYLRTYERQMNDYAQSGEFSSWNSGAQESQDQLSQLSYRNPATADANYATGLGIIRGAQAAGIGGAKVDWQAKVDGWKRENYGAVARQQVDTDPNAALSNLRGGRFDNYLPTEDIENLSRAAQNGVDRLQQKQMMVEQRALAQENRAEIQAERELRQTQVANAATWISGALKGGPVDVGKLADDVATQRISHEAADAVLHASEGHDDAQTVLNLHAKLASGDLQMADVFTAFSNHTIGQQTGVGLLNGIGEREKTGNNAADHGAYQAMRTALGSAAAEQGIDIFGADRAAAALRTSRAEIEWNDRVNLHHEPPQAVATDIIQRYSPNNATPTWLPQPKFGAIAAATDMPAVVQQTDAALAAGTITPDQYAAQGTLLSQYKTFFDAKQKRDAALAAVKAIKPAALPAAPTTPPTDGDGP